MSESTFTPAQQTFYDALIKADRGNVVIARKVLAAWQAGVQPEPDPEDFGAPVGTPGWALIEDAADAFDKAFGTPRDHETAVRAAMPVIDAVLAAKR